MGNYQRSARIARTMNRYVNNIRNYEYRNAPQNIGRNARYPRSVYMGNANG